MITTSLPSHTCSEYQFPGFTRRLDRSLNRDMSAPGELPKRSEPSLRVRVGPAVRHETPTLLKITDPDSHETRRFAAEPCCRWGHSGTEGQPPGRQKSPARRNGAVESTATFEKEILFSDRWWKVKDGLSGPGPNYFSDDPRNVWVDGDGKLHLRIERRHRRWYAAEVIFADELTYGDYRFVLDSHVDELEPNVVLGLFTWCDGADPNNCEVDIEFSRWGDASSLADNGSYVVLPYTAVNHVSEFYFPPVAASPHSFDWQPDSVLF